MYSSCTAKFVFSAIRLAKEINLLVGLAEDSNEILMNLEVGYFD